MHREDKRFLDQEIMRQGFRLTYKEPGQHVVSIEVMMEHVRSGGKKNEKWEPVAIFLSNTDGKSSNQLTLATLPLHLTGYLVKDRSKDGSWDGGVNVAREILYDLSRYLGDLYSVHWSYNGPL